MGTTVLEVAAVLLMAGGLLVIPLGVPGLWVMVGALVAAALAGAPVGWGTVLALAVLAAVAELAEYLAVKLASDRYGGSNRAFWGAIAGGVAGAVMGTPVPVVGSLLGLLLGTFGGAVAVAWLEVRDAGDAVRVGWGAVLGRAAAAAAKTAAGLAILVVSAGSFWLW